MAGIFGGTPPITHITEPGQCPAGSRVTVKLSLGELVPRGGPIAMATGCSIGRDSRKGARFVNSGSLESRHLVTSEQ